MSKNYPEDYKGPKAGKSSNKEWLAVREYDAFCYVRNEVWSYSDFDCYLNAMCREHYTKGSDAAVNALKEFQKKPKTP